MRAEQERTHDSLTVLTGITIRLEGAVSGLTMELAGLRSMVLDQIAALRQGAGSHPFSCQYVHCPSRASATH